MVIDHGTGPRSSSCCTSSSSSTSFIHSAAAESLGQWARRSCGSRSATRTRTHAAPTRGLRATGRKQHVLALVPQLATRGERQGPWRARAHLCQRNCACVLRASVLLATCECPPQLLLLRARRSSLRSIGVCGGECSTRWTHSFTAHASPSFSIRRAAQRAMHTSSCSSCVRSSFRVPTRVIQGVEDCAVRLSHCEWPNVSMFASLKSNSLRPEKQQTAKNRNPFTG